MPMSPGDQKRFVTNLRRKADDEISRLREDSDYEGESARAAYAFDLEKLAIELMGRRQEQEQRWIRAALQYSGQYDQDTLQHIRRRRGASELFVNMTRPKTTVLRARIADVMLPQDMANWDIQSSPFPDLPQWAIAEVRKELEDELKNLQEAAIAEAQAQQPAPAPSEVLGPDGQPMPGAMPVPAGPPPIPEDVPQRIQDIDEDTIFRFMKRKSDEIADRARLVMSDQLNDCQYANELFKVIHEMAKYGMGVMKGPLVEMKNYTRWMRQRDEETGNTVHVRADVKKPRPLFQHVHCWDLYPDPEASSIEDAEYVFELHRWSRKKLRNAAMRMGFDRKVTRRLLRENPKLGAIYQSFHEGLREIEHGDRYGSQSTRYYVWEYRGPADPDMIRPALSELGSSGEELREMLGIDEEDYDPLHVPNIVLYFCQGHILMLEPDVMDSNELPYSVATLDPDESSLYGPGIPEMIEHAQRALNAAWRLTMDSGALAGIPMFVVDDSLEPEDGVYEIRPGKIWRRSSNAVNTGLPGIEVVQIAASVAEGLEISASARQLTNDESMIPLIAHGEQAGGGQTAHGMTLLSNAVNTTFRQIVRSIDLFQTTPNLRRLYQWNRQFGPEGIDGDLEIQALGSSVLLVREVQAQQRMTALNLVSTDPELGDYVDKGELFSLVCQALQLPREKLLYEPDIVEVRRRDRLEAEQAAAGAGAQEKLQVEEIRQQGTQQVEERRQQTEMLRLESQATIAREKMAADMEKARIKARADERKLAVETALRRMTGQGV